MTKGRLGLRPITGFLSASRRVSKIPRQVCRSRSGYRLAPIFKGASETGFFFSCAAPGALTNSNTSLLAAIGMVAAISPVLTRTLTRDGISMRTQHRHYQKEKGKAVAPWLCTLPLTSAIHRLACDRDGDHSVSRRSRDAPGNGTRRVLRASCRGHRTGACDL